MMRFELIINGEKICVSGIKEFGVLTAILSWVKRNPELYDPENHGTFEEWAEEELTLRLGGLESNNPQIPKHVEWVRAALKAGDEIILRVLPPGEADLPKSMEYEEFLR